MNEVEKRAERTTNSLQQSYIRIGLIFVPIQYRREEDSTNPKLEHGGCFPKDDKSGSHVSCIVDDKMQWVFWMNITMGTLIGFPTSPSVLLSFAPSAF
jgi:hypothetical protein